MFFSHVHRTPDVAGVARRSKNDQLNRSRRVVDAIVDLRTVTVRNDVILALASSSCVYFVVRETSTRARRDATRRDAASERRYASRRNVFQVKR